jgi:hypothetical protein
MSSNLRFLSEKSLAAYEINMIEQWTNLHRRNVQKQALSFFALTAAFTIFAALALIIPASFQNLAFLFAP